MSRVKEWDGEENYLFHVIIHSFTEKVYGYCKECESLVSCREVFLCKGCKDGGLFQRSLATDIDHFAMNVNPEHLKGACGNCDKEGMEVSLPV